MNYIYDNPLLNINKNQTVVKYGTTYRFEKRYRRGDQIYYTFTSEGSQKVMVVPQFAQEFAELTKKIAALGEGKDYSFYRRCLRILIELEEENEIESDTSETGTAQTFSGQYRDIGVTVSFENGKLKPLPEFEIRQNNIFGTGIRVSIEED